ncbi:hypothetical protein P1S61_40350 [Streptomyces sp. ME08-AFT2]|uniref:hypothetical protein n=1 Tax=Streptomyces sp. ME08-AFT2 TaxID=3028683 RepID=UPI0029AD7DF5|nr:hypothetical protein [Streptomyces sp. ME08-AFT2]MDX3315192.1 hypothetical protein [Streptomyces sp. ME08-AFT2]
MFQTTGEPPDQTTPATPHPPDWSRAKVGDPAPCIACGRPALLRHPDTGQPHHKVCSEPAVSTTVDTAQQNAGILPCRFCGQPASLQGPEGEPEHWSCLRKAAER